MRKVVYTLLGVFVIVYLTSCSGIYYTPSAQNVGMFRKKGEVKLVATTGTAVASASQPNALYMGNSGSEEGEDVVSTVANMDFQVGAALTDHFGILVGSNFSSWPQGGGSISYEAGLGYYSPLGTSVWSFEAFGGFGNAVVHNDYIYTYGSIGENVNGYAKAQYFNVFLQPAFVLSVDHFQLALSNKFNRIEYNSFESGLDFPFGNVTGIEEGSDYWLTEPAVTLRAGWDTFQFHGQLGYSHNLTEPSFRQTNFFANFGFVLVPSNWFFKGSNR